MTVVNDDVLACTWKARHDDPTTKIRQTFYYQVTDVTDGNDATVHAELRDELIALYTIVANGFSDRYVLTAVKTTNQTQKTLLGENAGGGFAGTGVAGEVLPAMNCGLCVARHQALGQPGRKYVGPYLESVVANGQLDVAAQANLQSFVNRWDTQFIGATNNTYQPGTAQFVKPGGALAGFKPFSALLGTAFFDMRTQRSRRPGIGLT